VSYLRKNGKQYWVVAPECIGRDCLALGSYQHRALGFRVMKLEPSLSAEKVCARQLGQPRRAQGFADP
jgi:hypothetical protein